MPAHLFRLPGVAVLACVLTATLAPDAAAQGAERIVRTYVVSDLYMSGRPDDQPDPNPSRLGPDDPISRPSATRSEGQQAIIKLFRDTIDPRSWEKPYDRATDIVYRDGDLVITQTPANHRQIMSLLRQFRENPEGNKLAWKFGETRLPSKRFDEARLAAAIDWVAAESKVKIDVNWRDFQAAGIGPDSPVTLDLTKPLTERAIRAAVAAAAPGRDVPFYITPRPPTMLLKYDAGAKPTDDSSSAYDIHVLPARAAGLDPGKTYPRSEVVAALIKRVESATKTTGVRESNGLLIVNGKRPVQTEVRKYLDRLDAEAMEESAPRK